MSAVEWDDEGRSLGQLFAECRVLGQQGRDDGGSGIDLVLELPAFLSPLAELAANFAELLAALSVQGGSRTLVDSSVPFGED
ncbi:hypothetical protein ACFWP3_14530 [Streptomyces sp. NPDC058525]|uniref:hypothetical protein n=1 Tax=unclassified Streptomyces TaxID=2593676 RepID=UPI003646B8F0